MSFWTLFRVEVEKLARMKRVYLALLAISLWASLFTWGFLHWPKPMTARAASMLGMDVDELVNGFFFARMGLDLGTILLMPLFVCLVAGGQMAGETHDGTLRTLLTRPVSRPRLLAAKFAATGLYVICLAAFFAAVLLGLGIWLAGRGPLLAGSDWYRMLLSFETLPAADCPLRFAAAALLLGVSFLEVAACAFCFSCFTKHTSAAIIATLALYLLCVIVGTAPPLQEMDIFRELRPYLPTRPMEVWKQVFDLEPSWRRMVRDLAQIAAFTATFLGIAAAATDAKDVTA